MRQVLVDHARHRGRIVPGGGTLPASTDEPPRSRLPWTGLRARAEHSRWAALGGLAGALLLVGAVYLPLNLLADARGVTVFDPARLFVLGGRTLDERIPYLPWTLVLYYGAYAVLFATPVLAYPRSPAGARALFRLYGSLVLAALVAGTVFLLCPAEMTLRAGAEEPGTTLFGRAHLLLRRIDLPFNTWPSLHVALPCLILLVARRWLPRTRALLLWTLWAAVALSTLTVKQHYLWDVLTGALLGYGVWRWRWRPAEGG